MFIDYFQTGLVPIGPDSCLPQTNCVAIKSGIMNLSLNVNFIFSWPINVEQCYMPE